MQYIIRDFKVNVLPTVGVPNARYYVPNGNGTNLDEYVTDLNGNFRLVLSEPSATTTDELIKISSNDTTADYLLSKLIAGSNITLTENNDGSNETITISANIGSYWDLLGNSGTTAGTNFIGTIDRQPLVFKVGNINAGIIGLTTITGNIYTGSGGVGLGHYALDYLTTNNPTGNLELNTCIGVGAGRWIGYVGTNEDEPLETVSRENTLVGSWAGHYLQKRNAESNLGRNVAVGESAMYRSLGNSDSVAVGNFAMESSMKARGCTAVGRDALRSHVDGYGSVAIGGLSQAYASTGIKSVTITNGGSGYTTATVTISAPLFWNTPGTCWGVATATAVIVNGEIDDIIITDPGCGYTSKGGVYPSGGIWAAGATVTIAGDGTGATAIIDPLTDMISNESNTSLGSGSGLYRRMGTGNLDLGFNAGATIRYWDDYTIMIGYGTSVLPSISPLTKIEKSIAIGYGAQVAESNLMSLGGIGANAINVVIGGTTARATLDVVGNIAIEDLQNDDTETNLVAWNSTDKILEYRNLSSIISGTNNFLPVFNGNNSIITSRVNQYPLGVGGLGVDDLTTLITTTNAYVAVFRNSYAGDATSNVVPMILIDTQSNGATQKHMIRVQAPNMPDGSIIGNLLGKRASIRDMHFFVYRHDTNGSTNNYVEHQFHSIPNIQRIYASGNITIGSSISTDNGYKLEVGGTTKINGTLYLDSVTNDDTEVNLLTWNSTTKDVEYRTIGSLGVGSLDGSGIANQLSYWVDTDTLSNLDTTTYPSLTEISYVKGVTSSIQSQISAKQDTLVSGTNIKTINGTSLLGSGDISISTSISDGDKGDITVSSGGTVWTIDNLAITDSKINDVSWSKVTLTPTTLSGYGITDAVDGTGSTNRLAFWSDSNTLSSDSGFVVDAGNDRLSLGSARFGQGTFGSGGTPSISFTDDTTTGFALNGAANLVFTNSNQTLAQWNTAALRLRNSLQINWSSGDPTALGADIGLIRENIGVLRVSDGSSGRGDLEVLDEAYDATSWNGSLEVPTKNAVRDKIESLSFGITVGQALLDFGSTEEANASLFVADTNITLTSKIIVSVSAESTLDHSIDEILISGVTVIAGNNNAGVGFTIYGYTPQSTTGTYKINYTIEY